MLVDGTTPKHYDIRGPAGKRDLYLERVNFVIQDASMTYLTFGGLSALSNGMRVTLVDPNEVEVGDFLDGQAIKKNGHWVWLAGVDANLHVLGGSVSNYFSCRWTVSRGLGSALRLPTGWNLRFSVRDNISAMDEFRALGQGYLA
jgi:hypothetical protein